LFISNQKWIHKTTGLFPLAKYQITAISQHIDFHAKATIIVPALRGC